MRRGFTLIELLVVISIISLLASVVLASLNAAREKGRIGSMRYFATQVDHLAGEQATALWEFDECAGSSTADRSGFSNTASLAAGISWSSDTPAGSGCSLSFNGTGFASAGTSQLSIVDQMTLSFWMKSSGAQTAYAGLVSKDDAINRSWKIGMSSDAVTLRFDIFNASTYSSLYSAGPSLIDGRWHHVAVTYDGLTEKMYIDGSYNNTTTLVGGVRSSTAVIQIGNDGCCGGRIFNGLIDGVHVFSKPLVAEEVEKLYAAERRRMGIAEK